MHPALDHGTVLYFWALGLAKQPRIVGLDDGLFGPALSGWLVALVVIQNDGEVEVTDLKYGIFPKNVLIVKELTIVIF